MKGFLRAVALVFHPLFMPLYAAFIVLNFVPEIGGYMFPSARDFVYTVLALNVIAPIITIGNMVRKKVVSDVQISHRKERYLPLMFTLICYSLSYALVRYKLQSIYIPEELFSMLIGIIVSLALGLWITTFFKISLHGMGVSGVLGTVTALAVTYHFDGRFSEIFWVNLIIGVFGLVGFSRISTGHHTASEVLLGGFLGFSVNYIVVSNLWFV